MSLEAALESACDRLRLEELVVRPAMGGGFQAIAKSKKAMTGPWGCGRGETMAEAVVQSIESLKGELRHEKDRVAAFKEEPAPSTKPKRRGEDLA